MFRRFPFVFYSASRAGTTRPVRRFLSRVATNDAKTSNTLRRGATLAGLTTLVVASLIKTRKPVQLDAPPSTSESTCIDPDTKLEFPKDLIIPSRVRLPTFALIGLGVRRVSFIGIKVYSVGFYADLSNPNLNIPEDATPDEKINYIVSNTACVLRIIPTRSTSYTHLRDGFLRALQARMSAQLKNGQLSAEEAEEIQSPLRKLKSMFPNAPLSKGEPLDILLSAPPKKEGEKRALIARDLGSVESNWVAKEFIMAYFEGEGISPPMKRSVVQFLETKSATST